MKTAPGELSGEGRKAIGRDLEGAKNMVHATVGVSCFSCEWRLGQEHLLL